MHQPSPTLYPSVQPAWPRSLEAAATLLAESLPLEERKKLAAMPASTLDMLNSSTLGATARKRCGLWHGNPELLAACNALNPEEASLAIIRALRDRLRG